MKPAALETVVFVERFQVLNLGGAFNHHFQSHFQPHFQSLSTTTFNHTFNATFNPLSTTLSITLSNPLSNPLSTITFKPIFNHHFQPYHFQPSLLSTTTTFNPHHYFQPPLSSNHPGLSSSRQYSAAHHRNYVLIHTAAAARLSCSAFSASATSLLHSVSGAWCTFRPGKIVGRHYSRVSKHCDWSCLCNLCVTNGLGCLIGLCAPALLDEVHVLFDERVVPGCSGSKLRKPGFKLKVKFLFVGFCENFETRRRLSSPGVLESLHRLFTWCGHSPRSAASARAVTPGARAQQLGGGL